MDLRLFRPLKGTNKDNQYFKPGHSKALRSAFISLTWSRNWRFVDLFTDLHKRHRGTWKCYLSILSTLTGTRIWKFGPKKVRLASLTLSAMGASLSISTYNWVLLTDKHFLFFSLMFLRSYLHNWSKTMPDVVDGTVLLGQSSPKEVDMMKMAERQLR